MFREPIESQFSHITIEKVDLPWSIEAIEEHIIADELPDLNLRDTAGMQMIRETGIFMDLEPYIEKYDFDLSILKPEMVDLVKGLGEIIGDVNIPVLPVNIDHSAMLYNKDIFDLMGVDYPTDGMTWEEVIELAKEVTREVDGIQYRGLVTMPPTYVLTQLSLHYVDPETEEPVVNSPEWRKGLETLKEMHTIQGNEDSHGWHNMFGDRNIAMLPRVNIYEQTYSLTEEDIHIDWDIVQYPYFSDQPNVGYGSAAHNVLVSSMTEHPDDAFLALTAILSDEAQQIAAEYMKIPVVDNEELSANFGKNFPIFEGKNVEAILKTEAAPVPIDKFTIYDDEARHIVNRIFEEKVIGEDLDINSAIRLAEEEIAEMIQDIKGGK